MKAIVAVVIFLGLPSVVWAQKFTWGKSFSVFTDITAVAIDSHENVIIAGGFEQRTVVADDTLSAPGVDGFIAKYDSNGHALWYRQLGALRLGGYSCVNTDRFGNIYMFGGFYDSLVLDGELLVSPKSMTALALKYSGSGELLWSRRFPGSIGGESKLDNYGNFYAFGRDISDSTVSVFWVAKFDEDGDLLFHSFPTVPSTENHFLGYRLVVDADENFYIFGTTYGQLLIGDVPFETGPHGSIALVKFNKQGVPQWVKKVQDVPISGGSYHGGIAVDWSGNIFAPLDNDEFGIEKYDANGNVLWTRPLRDQRISIVESRITENGDLVVAGTYSGTFSIDGITFPMQPRGIFVAGMDKSGIFQWVITGRNEQNDYLFDMARSRNTGDLYVCGSFQSEHPSFGDIEFSGSSSDYSNGYLLKISNVPGHKPLVLDLGEDTGLCPGKKLPIVLSGYARYQWQDGSTDSVYMIAEPGKYYVSVIDKAGYLQSDTLYVAECFESTIPNVITPNGDEHNEFFVIQRLDLTLPNRLRIIDRWGKLIYSTNDYRNDWNGDGHAPGVYYYELFNATDRRKYRGWIQVM